MSKFSVTCALALAGLATAASAAPQKGLPPNTIDCKDFTKLSNGLWLAHHNAKPFDLGTTTHTHIWDVTFAPDTIRVGGYDLSDMLDRKCGQATSSGM